MKTKPLGPRLLENFKDFLRHPPELADFAAELDKRLPGALLSGVDVMGETIAWGGVEHIEYLKNQRSLPIPANAMMLLGRTVGDLDNETATKTVEKLNYLLAQDVSPNKKVKGYNLWHNLSHGFHPDIYAWLEKQGVSPADADSDGNTVLHTFVRSVESGVSDMFLGALAEDFAGVNIKSSDGRGEYLLGGAMGDALRGLMDEMPQIKEELNDEVVTNAEKLKWLEKLIDLGCDPWKKNKQGLTAFSSVMPEQGRMELSFFAENPGESTGAAFMSFVNNQNDVLKSPNSYSRLALSAIRLMEEKTGKRYLKGAAKKQHSPRRP